MRLAKYSVTIMAQLILLAGFASSTFGQTPAPASEEGKQAAKARVAPKQAAPAASKAKSPVQKAVKNTTPPKEPAKGTAKASKGSKSEKATAASGTQAPAKVARRDPFNPLVGTQQTSGPSTEHLPPGKAGLVVSSLRLDGIVRGPNGMIAVVSNPQQRVYFLRDGDQLYDGRVDRISMEAVAFHEVGKDAFGKPVERQVAKRLYPSSGEQR